LRVDDVCVHEDFRYVNYIVGMQACRQGQKKRQLRIVERERDGDGDRNLKWEQIHFGNQIRIYYLQDKDKDKNKTRTRQRQHTTKAFYKGKEGLRSLRGWGSAECSVVRRLRLQIPV